MLPIPFSALNSSTHFNTPKLRLAAKNIPFLQKTSTPPYVWKITLFYTFCARGCVASHVESEPPGILCVFIFTLKPQLMQVTYAPDKPQLFWLREKPEDPQFEPHARIKMAHVLGSPVYIYGLYVHVKKCWLWSNISYSFCINLLSTSYDQPYLWLKIWLICLFVSIHVHEFIFIFWATMHAQILQLSMHKTFHKTNGLTLFYLIWFDSDITQFDIYIKLQVLVTFLDTLPDNLNLATILKKVLKYYTRL